MADWFTWHISYGMTLFIFLWLCIELTKWLKPKINYWLRNNIYPALGLGLTCIAIHLAEPHFFKVLADEPTHAATALCMHMHKIVSVPVSKHFPYETIPWDYTSAPFRGHFFPFLVSLAHDFTGFRTENIYIVNGFIGWVSLITIYAIGQRLTGRRDLSFAISMGMAGAPIFGQVMCSGSYDLTNLMLISALSYFLIRLATGDSLSRENITITMLLSVILAYSRPESILYYGASCLIIIFFYIKDKSTSRKDLISMPISISPLLFAPSLCTQIILLSNPVHLTQNQLEKGKPIVSIAYGVEHWKQTFVYFLNSNNMNMSNVLLFIIGTFSILLTFTNIITNKGRNILDKSLLTLFILSCVIIGLYSMIMFSFWGGPTVQVMTRFTLPLWFLLCLFCFNTFTMAQKTHTIGWIKWSPYISLAYFLTFTLPAHSSGESINSMFSGYANHQAMEWVDKNDDKNTIFTGDSALQFIARKHSAVGTKTLESNTKEYINLVKSDIIGRIVLVEFQITDPKDGKSIIHERNWRNSAKQWKTKRLWSNRCFTGMNVVADELIGVTFNGTYYDLTVKEPQLPTGMNYFDMRQKAEALIPQLNNQPQK